MEVLYKSLESRRSVVEKVDREYFHLFDFFSKSKVVEFSLSQISKDDPLHPFVPCITYGLEKVVIIELHSDSFYLDQKGKLTVDLDSVVAILSLDFILGGDVKVFVVSSYLPEHVIDDVACVRLIEVFLFGNLDNFLKLFNSFVHLFE